VSTAQPQSPLLSVCIPTFQSAGTILRCLTSIATQDMDDLEILVVDDRSSDSTVAIVEGFSEVAVRVVVNDTNLGLVGNHNRCLELAQGRLIQFVHADDYLLPGALRTMTEQFDDPRVTLAVSARTIDSDDEAWVSRFRTLWISSLSPGVHDGTRVIRRYLREGRGQNWFGEPTCVMFDRERALALGGFKPEIAQLLDMDMWLRLIAAAWFSYVDTPQSVRVQHGGTTTVRNREGRRDWLDIAWTLAGIATQPDLPASVRAAARARWVLEVARAALWVSVRGKGRRRQLTRLLRAHVTGALARSEALRKEVPR
jgi:glycosyltransferase involved in cell wall biosynthesis